MEGRVKSMEGGIRNFLAKYDLITCHLTTTTKKKKKKQSNSTQLNSTEIGEIKVK